MEKIESVLNCDFLILKINEKNKIQFGSEMTFAKIYNIPIYSIIPQNETIETINDNVFIYELSDRVFANLKELIKYLNDLYNLGKLKKKGNIKSNDIIDKINSFDAGYDEGYKVVEKFWGEKPANFVKRVADIYSGKKNVKCLDLGCGNGKNAIYLSNSGFDVTAMDVSYYGINEARRLCDKVNWIIRDIRKYYAEEEKYDIVVLTGSLHCLSTYEEVENVINSVKKSTKQGGYNVISAFNNDVQDLSGHSKDFHPLLLEHSKYVNMYKDWKIIESSNKILNDIHPNNNIKHKHSITRILAQKI